MAWRVKGETDPDPVNNIRFLQKAISLNRGPDLPSLLQELGWVYAGYGFPEKALKCYMDRLNLDGNTAEYYSSAARDEFWQGNYEKALELEKKGYETDSANTLILEFMAVDYQWLGQNKESLKYFTKWIEILKSRGILAESYYFRDNYLFNMAHRVAYAYWQNGYKKEADSFFDEEINYCNTAIKLRREYGRLYYSYYDLAGVYAFRGDKKKAIENLKKYSDIRVAVNWMVLLIKTDPLLKSIRSLSEFQQVESIIEAKYNADHEKVAKWLEQEDMV